MNKEQRILELEKELKTLRDEQLEERQLNRKDALNQLVELRKVLDKTMKEAQEIACNNGFVFWYESGYESFQIEDESEWHSSSCYGSY